VRRDGVQYHVPRIRGGTLWEGDVVAEGSAETVEAAGRPAQTLETWTIGRRAHEKGLATPPHPMSRDATNVDSDKGLPFVPESCSPLRVETSEGVPGT
jgi:hypothetical protein